MGELDTAARPTIYRTPAAEERILGLYDGFVERWPVPVTESDLDSEWGSIHVLSRGPDDGRPLLLIHAASMAATSWSPNASVLAAAGFRCHAVDYIGEAGKSRLLDLDRYPKSGLELGHLYASIAEQLGIAPAPVVAASAGGHVALRLALTAMQKVERLALLGPMGIPSLSIGALTRMMIASIVPRAPVVESTSRWALGSSPEVTSDYGEWFASVLAAVSSPPRVARPVALSSEESGRIEVPVLLVLGTQDNLVGDPARAADAAAALPDLRVETLESSHLLGVERADEVNELLVAFLGET